MFLKRNKESKEKEFETKRATEKYEKENHDSKAKMSQSLEEIEKTIMNMKPRRGKKDRRSGENLAEGKGRKLRKR